MAAEFLPDQNKEIRKIAEGLIKDFHTHLEHAQIRYDFRVDERFSKGQKVLGDAKKCSPFEKHKNGNDFEVQIDLTYWNQSTQSGREAVLDFYLSFCGGELVEKKDKETGHLYKEWRWFKNAPEVVEFIEVHARRGPWRPAMKELFQDSLRELRAILEDRDGMSPELFLTELVQQAELLCGVRKG